MSQLSNVVSLAAASPSLFSNVPEETNPIFDKTRQHATRANGGFPIPRRTRRELLRIVRAAQPISRTAVAQRLGVNRATVSMIVKPLLNSGVLREAAPERKRGRGRPAIGLTLRAQREFLIGVGIGVHQIQIGAASGDGRLLCKDSFTTPRDWNEALVRIRLCIEDVCARLPERKLMVVGVSAPGPIDVNRRLLYAPHLGWRDVEIGSVLELAAPVIVENSATAAAIYESQRRRISAASRAPGNFVLVRVGTGIGVGLVLGGDVYRGTGSADLAGEFGHMTIVAGGRECPCGNRGCWERYASAGSAVELYASQNPWLANGHSLRFADIVSRAAANERRAQETLESVGTHLGIGIGNVICGLGVPQVVLSGEIVHGWRFIEKPARAAIARSLAGRLSRWSLECGESHGSEVGGALEVAIEHYLLALIASAKAAA